MHFYQKKKEMDAYILKNSPGLSFNLDSPRFCDVLIKPPTHIHKYSQMSKRFNVLGVFDLKT